MRSTVKTKGHLGSLLSLTKWGPVGKLLTLCVGMENLSKGESSKKDNALFGDNFDMWIGEFSIGLSQSDKTP